MSEYRETLHEDYGQFFKVDNMLHEVHTELQHLVIFENARMGRVMALDGAIQTTEADEFFYHEMLTHVPILAHGLARNILIIGGGDGGMLREVCRHSSVDSITWWRLIRLWWICVKSIYPIIPAALMMTHGLT